VLKPEVTDPKYERRLVEQAKNFTAEQLRRVLGCARNVLKGGAEAAAERERRTYLKVEQLGGGMTVIQCFLPSDVAARVVGVVECAMEDLVKKRPQGSADELVETLDDLTQKSAELSAASTTESDPSDQSGQGGEAEVEYEAESEAETEADENGVVSGSAADPTGSNGPRRAGDPAGSPRVHGLRPSVGMVDGFVAVFEHYAQHRSCAQPGKPGEVLLTVSADTLTGTMANRCHLSPALVHQWTSDAVVQPVLTDAKGEVLDVGRRHRVVPPRLRRALGLRDGEACQFPGCGARAFLEAHHLEPWLAGGETKIDNLALICRRHHRFLHQAKFRVELTAEGLVFRDPSGKALVLGELPLIHQPRSELHALLRESRFTPDGLKCRDGKTNYDFHMAVGGFLHGVTRGQMRGPLAPADHFSQVASAPSWVMPDGTFAFTPTDPLHLAPRGADGTTDPAPTTS